MILLENIFPRQARSLRHSFKALPSIEQRAFNILKKRSQVEIEAAALLLSVAITQYIEDDLESEIDKYVDRLYEKGGWELGYLPDDGYRPTRNDIDDLIRSWPSHYDDKPDIPLVQDYDELRVLEEIIDDVHYQQLIYPDGTKSVDLSAHEYYAVFSLTRINDALNYIACPGEILRSTQMNLAVGTPQAGPHLIQAGNLLLSAMEAICLGERYLSDEVLDGYREVAKNARVEQESLERATRDQQIRKQINEKLIKMRWEKTETPRELAKKIIGERLKEWDRDRSLYSNQMEFAIAMELIIPKGENGKPIYTATTIQVKLIQKIRLGQ